MVDTPLKRQIKQSRCRNTRVELQMLVPRNKVLYTFLYTYNFSKIIIGGDEVLMKIWNRCKIRFSNELSRKDRFAIKIPH